MGSTYFDGGNSDIQSSAQGNLQTLYLMNPTYVPYSHLDALNLPTLSHAPPPHLLALTIPQQQGLSLSLSPHQQITAANNYNRSLSGGDDDEMQIAVGGNSSVILGSKYVKAAQELLDEVVNVGNSLQMEGKETSNYNKHKIIKPNNTSQSQSDDRANIIDASSCKQPPPQPELTTAQRQDLHMNKSKLLTMLDQVEQRYRQYRAEMQIVISSFEEAAGYGGAKSYTALALKTISKQFRCLKDAISSQIKATSKRLGSEDQDCLGIGSGNRLRYVDHHVRQQRALQQLGMMQHNAWRPQRGLPERAVSILRAWLFEHFLHPYPKDSDKVMLAKQTGLTRSQVSNWFINARVRLWKPMVEEMYLEETKDEQQKSNENNTISTKDETSNKVVGMEMVEANNNSNAGPNMMMIRSFDDQMKSADHTTFNMNQASSSLSDVISSSSNSGMGMDNNNIMEMKPPNNINININIKDGYKYLSGGYAAGAGMGFSSINGRFNIDDNNVVSEQQQHLAPRFHGNGVSLTLGLPHNTDNNNNHLSHHHHHVFLSHLGTNNNINASSDSDLCAITTPPPSHNSGTYANLDIHNRRKSFPTQLLPDFVT